MARSRWWVRAERLGLVESRAARPRVGSRRWWGRMVFLAVWMVLIGFVFLPLLHRL